MSIAIYIKPACVQCTAAMNAMEGLGITFEIYDVSVDETALTVTKELGYLQIPVTITADDHWSGFREDKIAGLVLSKRHP